MTPLSINSRSNSGEVTIKNASITTVIKKIVMYFLYGFAYDAIRFTVPGFNF
jgi:hypothetical protein